ncbi:hypothetical protein CSUI_005268 [Cystoisospora suis]|uniref:Transmembrane protein n=1 Tax=Cystoisospora suis TaxID=483139 RepID=A0A2C6KVT1_9APIC|nr:hypothetical protein CSUI_005268 [Cystoisospora suis]
MGRQPRRPSSLFFSFFPFSSCLIKERDEEIKSFDTSIGWIVKRNTSHSSSLLLLLPLFLFLLPLLLFRESSCYRSSSSYHHHHPWSLSVWKNPDLFLGREKAEKTENEFFFEILQRGEKKRRSESTKRRKKKNLEGDRRSRLGTTSQTTKAPSDEKFSSNDDLDMKKKKRKRKKKMKRKRKKRKRKKKKRKKKKTLDCDEISKTVHDELYSLLLLFHLGKRRDYRLYLRKQ